MLGKITHSATFRQSSITLVGTFFNGALGALFYIIIARLLGPSDFGLLVLSITILTLLSDISDLGTNTGLVKFVSQHLVSERARALQFLKLGLELKLVVWVVLLILGQVLSPFLAESIFMKPELVLPLRLVFVGVGGSLLFSFATSTFQAMQTFSRWSLVNIVTNLLRLGLIITLVFYQNLNLTTALVAYISLPFLGFFMASAFLPSREIIKARGEWKVLPQMFNYNRWVAIITLVSALSSRLDTFLVGRLLTVQELGIYSAANQATIVMVQVVSSFGVVAAPKFAGFQTLTQMIQYFKKLQLLTTSLGLLSLLVIPLAYFLIPVLFGQSYFTAFHPFIFLWIAMIIFLVAVPVHNAIYYYFGRPDFFVLLAVVNLLTVGGTGYILTGRFGVQGAAVTVLVGMVLNFVIPLIWFLNKISFLNKIKK